MTDERREPVLLVHTPAESAAVGMCLLNRIFPNSESHPIDGCRWCPYSRDQLHNAIAYFEITAEWDGIRYRADHCAAFYELPERDQKRMVREAQAVEVPA